MTSCRCFLCGRWSRNYVVRKAMGYAVCWRHYAPGPLVTVCAWCPDNAARMRAAHRKGLEVTHGICPAHAAEFERPRAEPDVVESCRYCGGPVDAAGWCRGDHCAGQFMEER